MLKDKRVWWAGGALVALAALIALSLPAGSAAQAMEATGNHFKCYSILDWTVWEPTTAKLKDQFGDSTAHLYQPKILCNPVDKNGEGIPHPSYHLVCYDIKDDPAAGTPRIKEVTVKNQFQEAQLWVGDSNLLCVPSDKSYEPRQ